MRAELTLWLGVCGCRTHPLAGCARAELTLRLDVDGADGLSVLVGGHAGVLALVSGADPADEKAHLARLLVVLQLVLGGC